MQFEYFRFIDRIIAIDLAARTIKVEANVPIESTIFEGHFTGYPLMPGVLLLETMAQASAWLAIGVTKFTRLPLLAATKEVKFRSFATPGMALTVDATLEHEGSGYMVTRAAIACEGKAICNAQITLRLLPFPNPQVRASMEKLAAAIAFPMELSAHG